MSRFEDLKNYTLQTYLVLRRAWLGRAYARVLTSCKRMTSYTTSTAVHMATSQQEN